VTLGISSVTLCIRHLPIRFSELANTPHSPVANAKAEANGQG